MTDYISQLVQRYGILASVEGDIRDSYEIIRKSYEAKGKLLIGGNGGSCADSEHIVGELMKGFVKKRELEEAYKKRLEEFGGEEGKRLAASLQGSLPAIAITNHQALSTAFANDVCGDMAYAQQVSGYGNEGDVLLAISTSGNALNLYYAAVTAKAMGLKVIALSGKTGGRLAQIADKSIIVPNNETYMIQELHLPIYHAFCLQLEEYFFAD